MKIGVTRDDVLASICRDCFYEFLQEFWDTVVPEAPSWNWHMQVLCYELQRLAERVFKGEDREEDLIINISPGTTKSTICSIMFPAWVWTRMPTARMICASYAYPLSMDLSRRSRMVIQSPKYQRLYPGRDLIDDQNAKGYFVNSQGGMRFATSTGGSVTGMHGHFIIIDDPLDPNQAASEQDLKTANRWISETLSTRKVNKKTTPTILIMQRLHQGDPTGEALAKKAKKPVRRICLPAELTEAVSPARLRRYYRNGLMDADRLPWSVLEDSKATLGQYGYAAQFLQSPIPPGGAMFKVSRLHVEKQAPPITDFVKIGRYWDKAGTEGGGAYTVGGKMGMTKTGEFWILNIRRGQWDSDEREKIIVQTAILDTKNVVIAIEQEPGSGGKESAQQTVKRLAGFRVRVDRPTGDKVLRADPFSVQVNGGNVYIVDEEWTRECIDEMMYFPFSRYKDQVDSLSGAFAQLVSLKKKVGALARK